MRFNLKTKSVIYMVLNILSFLLLVLFGMTLLGKDFFYYVGRGISYPYRFLFERAFDFKTLIVIATMVLVIVTFGYYLSRLLKKESIKMQNLLAPITILIMPFMIFVAIRANSIGIWKSKEIALVILTLISLVSYIATSILYLIDSFKNIHQDKIKKIEKNKTTVKVVKGRKIKKPFTALVLMQLRDKLDFSWTKNTKERIIKVALSLLKFVLVTVVAYLIIHYSRGLLNLFYHSEIIDVMIVVVGVLFVLSIISCAAGLMKNLYFSDDNKVLVTLPVTSDQLFFSKLIVFFVFEMKKNINFLLPIILAFVYSGFQHSQVSWVVFIWLWIPFILITLLPVLIGSLISIPLMYISRFFKKFPVIETIVILIAIVCGIALVVFIINLIPENINLALQWPYIRSFINNFLTGFKAYLSPLAYLVYAMVGNPVNMAIRHQINLYTVLSLLAVIALVGALIGISYITAKPLFFSMMTKSFEFDKNIIDREKKNKVRKPFITFVNKDFQINFRSVEISGNYLAVYIIVPILILLLNSIFAAMNTKLSGDIMTYAFNMLLILLPLLASNSMIATFYSKEGRAGYIKKTKPVNPIYPLVAKLLFNLVLSIPSIIITLAIFGRFSGIEIGNVILLSVAVLFIQYAHIFFSATMDIMNPQNEQYATVGDSIDNPNERNSTLLAFGMSIAIALISYFLFTESLNRTGSFIQASLKLAIIGLALLLFAYGSFALRIKAYYYEK
ncbi:MAG: hypothetical protein J1F32_04965 [Erysipelotrichales bacterium]|nr:hypothetical protein [Erysipelotrichales bacterium]